MSNLPTFIEGERISVVYRNVRVLGEDEHGNLRVEMPNIDDAVEIRLVDDDGEDLDVEIVRLAPADWPPRHGDLWHDTHGTLWAGISIPDDDTVEEPYVAMVPLRPNNRNSADPDRLLQDRGPLELVHRLGGAS